MTSVINEFPGSNFLREHGLKFDYLLIYQEFAVFVYEPDDSEGAVPLADIKSSL
jgi:hypothetical protein